MFRISITTLLYDRSRLFAAMAGVAFSTTLTMTQLGLYYGFLDTASAIITRAGGDLWVMARGTPVLDNMPAISAVSRDVVSSHEGVARVRAFVMGYATMQTRTGSEEFVEIVGLEQAPDVVFPWSIRSGLPGDLIGPMRVSVDDLDLPKLHLTETAIGGAFSIGGKTVTLQLLTHGIRSFTLQPYVFADVETARTLSGLSGGQVHGWIVDLKPGALAAGVIREIERHSDLQALPTSGFVRATQDYWVGGSGAGAVLAFGAIFGLLVGSVIVGQTLYGVTRDNLQELATLKALGCRRDELVAFVAWQVAFLTVLGGAIGIAMTYAVEWFGRDFGLVATLSPRTFAMGFGAVLTMCVLSSLASIRSVLRLSPGAVFR